MTTVHLVAIAAALAIAAQYIVGISYAAPRFLEPTYALLALPVAEGLVWAVRAIAPIWRPVAIVVLGLAFVAQVLNQTGIVHQLDRQVAISTAQDRAVAQSLELAGVRGGCSITGFHAQIVAFMAGCTDVRQPTSATATTVSGTSVAMAVLQQGAVDHPSYFSRWPEYWFQTAQMAQRWHVWILPRRVPTGTERLRAERYGLVSPGPRGAVGGRLP